MDGCVFDEKLSIKILGLPFSSKLAGGTYILSVAKTVLKKIETLICCTKFPSSQFVFCLINLCFHV